MEPLMPSEIARLVYGYLKHENNEMAAECFLKSSPHLTECYQIFKANKNFNIKVNGLNLHNIFDIFGTMCSMINERIPEICESKTLIEKLEYLLNVNHISTKNDIGVGTEIYTVDKCIGDMINTEDKSTNTSIDESKKSTTERIEIPLFTNMINSNISETKEIELITNDMNIIENNLITPRLSSTSQLLNHSVNTLNFSSNDNKDSPKFKINDQTCSTPIKKLEETKQIVEPILQCSPKNIQYFDQLECQQIPEATSLDSMPGLSKEDKFKDNSIVVDTGELIDTLLNDQNLLEKIADTINKSISDQTEINIEQDSKILDTPTLEKALDSTQSDPQIKNVLDEFLVFNVDNNSDDNKNNQENSIKSRLRSSKIKDDGLQKFKKNNLNSPKNIINTNDESRNNDNILLFHEGNIKSTLYENYKLLSSQVILQSNNSIIPETEAEDYVLKGKYKKIAPKRSSLLKTHQTLENRIFPKRKKRSLIDFGIKSKFKTKNITITTPKVTPKPDQSTQSIIIEVPNQNSFETQENNIALPEVSGNVNAKDTVAQETPDDILKPPKNKSMSTPRRRSTHIRCLDFSTPQPKNSTRDKARSKLFCGTPKIENIVEENTVIESPLPKLQADWGSVNGFESIVRKENAIHWDSDIRDMVGAGILTSDADGDGRKKKKKKIPRKTIKTKDDKNNVSFEEQNKSNNSSEINELHTDETDKSKNQFILNNSNTNKLLIDDNKSLDILNNEFPISLETPNKATILCKEQLPIESNSKKSLSNSTLLNKQSQPFILLEKSTEFIKEQLSTESNSYNNFNDLKFSNKHSIFSISLETPDKITELSKEQSPIKSNSVKNKKSKKQTKFSISFKTPDKMKELSPQIKSTTKKSLSKTQTKPEVSVTVINEHENKLNTSTVGNCSNSIIISDVTEKDKDKKKDSNFLESFNNINYLKHPDNKLNDLTGNLIKSTLLDQNETHNSDHKNPLELVENQIINHNLIDTPYKSDDAVDVPETPISKIIREYDQSKLVTPLPCTPQHYEDSTETPLTKVFRETSYLNRPPISPFPPTPGNSRSVDTLIVPPEQENPRNFNITSCKVNNSNEVLAQPPIQINNNNESLIKTKKNKLTPFKTKTQNQKKKIIDAKQVYETIKDELFGSEISSSSSVENTPTKKSKQLIINKKTQENEKKSGFKPIPKRKIIQSKVVNNAENHTLSECNSKLIKSTSIIATIPSTLQSKNISLEKTEKDSNIKSSSKSKKYMVHFDDPVEKCYNLSLNENLSKSVNNNREIENKIKINQEPKQSNEGNKYSSQSNIFDKCNSNENNIKKTEPEIKIIKLNNSDSNINYLKKYNEIKCDDKILNQLPECLNNKTKMNDSGNEQNKLSRICTTDEAKKSMILNKLNYASLTSPSVKTSNQSQTELTKVNYNNKNNISCISIGHTDESFQLSKYDDQFNNLEYLKKTIMYEVINEDGEHDMVYINLSESFNLLDIPSTLNNTASLNPVTSPLITKNLLDITPKIEFSQIKDNEDIPMTSTPRDYTEKKSNERQERLRRSPSFWEDSNTNYPIKYRDKHRESNSFRNKNHRDRYDNKQRTKQSFRHHDERLQTDNRNRLQRNHRNGYDERDFRDDSINYKNRYKHKEDKRSFGIYHGYNYDERNSHAHYVHDRLDDSDRFSNLQKISQNDSHKLNRIEDIKKATKRPADRTDYNKTSAKVSKVEHQRLLKNIDVDDFLSVVHGRKSK